MDQTHIHLLINHLPVMGSFVGMVVLLYGLLTRSAQTQNAALLVFIICALGAGITYFTGETAEETVEHLPGISEMLVEEHEDAGKLALLGMAALGLASAVGLVMGLRRRQLHQTFSWAVMLVALVALSFTGYAANLGGKIRHPEITGNSTPALAAPAEAEHHEEE